MINQDGILVHLAASGIPHGPPGIPLNILKKTCQYLNTVIQIDKIFFHATYSANGAVRDIGNIMLT